jgi:hypothetical protein
LTDSFQFALSLGVNTKIGAREYRKVRHDALTNHASSQSVITATSEHGKFDNKDQINGRKIGRKFLAAALPD